MKKQIINAAEISIIIHFQKRHLGGKVCDEIAKKIGDVLDIPTVCFDEDVDLIILTKDGGGK